MTTKLLLDKASQIRKKFKEFLFHRKQVQALENYACVAPFRFKYKLELLKTCIEEGFLDDKEAEFLEHMIKKSEISVHDWSYKTKWLRTEMRRRSFNQEMRTDPKEPRQYIMFPQAEEKQDKFNFPFNFLKAYGKRSATQRRV